MVTGVAEQHLHGKNSALNMLRRAQKITEDDHGLI